MNLYELLRVDASADRAELARAYRRRLRQLHPDGHSATAADQRREPAHDLAAVQHAYQVLRDPIRRARYDTELRATELRDTARRDTELQAGDAGTRGGAGNRWTGRPVPIAVRVHRARRPDVPLIRVGRVRVHPLPSSREPHRPA